jgi:hypothetical protein
MASIGDAEPVLIAGIVIRAQGGTSGAIADTIVVGTSGAPRSTSPRARIVTTGIIAP